MQMKSTDLLLNYYKFICDLIYSTIGALSAPFFSNLGGNTVSVQYQHGTLPAKIGSIHKPQIP